MGATHVIRHDFQLRFGIHAGPIREQQVPTELRCIGPLRLARHIDRTIENCVEAPCRQTFLELIQLTIGPFKTHRRMHSKLLLSVSNGQTLQRGGGLSVHLNHPWLDPTQRPTLNNRREGVSAAGLLLDGHLSEQRRHAIGTSQDPMVQLRFLTEMNLQKVTVGRFAPCRKHL